jgi:hypothetical protein
MEGCVPILPILPILPFVRTELPADRCVTEQALI